MVQVHVHRITFGSDVGHVHVCHAQVRSLEARNTQLQSQVETLQNLSTAQADLIGRLDAVVLNVTDALLRVELLEGANVSNINQLQQLANGTAAVDIRLQNLEAANAATNITTLSAVNALGQDVNQVNASLTFQMSRLWALSQSTAARVTSIRARQDPFPFMPMVG